MEQNVTENLLTTTKSKRLCFLKSAEKEGQDCKTKRKIRRSAKSRRIKRARRRKRRSRTRERRRRTTTRKRKETRVMTEKRGTGIKGRECKGLPEIPAAKLLSAPIERVLLVFKEK